MQSFIISYFTKGVNSFLSLKKTNLPRPCQPDNIECYIEDQAVSPTCDLAHFPTPSPSNGDTQGERLIKRDNLRKGGEEGLGKEPNQTNGTKPGPLWYIKYSLVPTSGVIPQIFTRDTKPYMCVLFWQRPSVGFHCVFVLFNLCLDLWI